MNESSIKILCQYHQLFPLEDLRPHPDNENKHPEAQIKALADIIRKDGMRHPIIVSKLSGYIVAGHGRLMALMLIKAEDKIDIEAPVQFQQFDDPIQELRVRTADNKIASYAEFDLQKFEQNLMKHDLSFQTVNMPEFGFVKFDLPAEVDPPSLPEGDKQLKQISFIVTHEQHDLINDAIKMALKDAPEDELNPNKNGNALSHICELYRNGFVE